MCKTGIMRIVSLVLFLSISFGGVFAGEAEGADEKPEAERSSETYVANPQGPIEEAKSNVSYTAEQEYLFDTFRTRRSVRKFRSTPIPKEHIMKILDIARSAPTAGNQQPWKFLVIQDKEKIKQLREESVSDTLEFVKNRGDLDPAKLDETRAKIDEMYGSYLSAPVYVAVLVDSDSEYPDYNTYDGTLAAGYLIIAARALGYGTVFTTDSFPYERLKKVFNIPDNFDGICFIPIGVPDKWPESPEKKPLEEFVVFEKFAPKAD